MTVATHLLTSSSVATAAGVSSCRRTWWWGDYKAFTGFASSLGFQKSVAHGARRGGALISTDREEQKVSLHGDGGSRGRPAPVGRSPRTVLGGTNTADYPTVLAARREMSSWRVLHLEPSAMRTPDTRWAVPHVSASGAHLPATLHALVARDPDTRVEIVNRLRHLNSDVEDLDVHADDVRDQLALRARVPGVDNWLYGRSLSDGTLRYIALVLMLVDVQDRAVLCIEEPENGIHPSRVPHLVDLLRDYAVDVQEPVDSDNPLRQVIVNTHSPEVARQLDYENIVFVERARTSQNGRSVCSVRSRARGEPTCPMARSPRRCRWTLRRSPTSSEARRSEPGLRNSNSNSNSDPRGEPAIDLRRCRRRDNRQAACPNYRVGNTSARPRGGDSRTGIPEAIRERRGVPQFL